MSETQKTRTKNKKSPIIILLTSKFFWLVIVFLLIVLIIAKTAYDLVEEARSIYEGLPEEAGYENLDIDINLLSRDEYNFLSYSDDKYETRRGIDVSEHQASIDWEKVSESGVEFAIIRLGYTGNDTGTKYLDVEFEENVKGAARNGIDVGVYYFSQAITVEEAIEEAKFVCEHLRGKDIKMPVAFDMEPLTGTESDRISGLSMREITEIADAFCTVVEKHGYDTLIYGNPTWIYSHFNLSLLTHRKIWLAHYNHATKFPYKYVIWQYSDSGTIEGISTGVDLNIQFIEKKQNP